MNTIKIIIGQTATGKTSRAIKLAEECNGELINCDARQIYRGLNIVTGKDLPPNVKFQISNFKTSDPRFSIGYYQLPTARIWLYDIVDPKVPFSSFDWNEVAIPVLRDIIGRGRTPIIVGGTGFYLTHLLRNISTATIKPDWQLRKELADKTAPELLAIYRTAAPGKAALLNGSEQGNAQRLIRRIEISRHKESAKDTYHVPDFARELQAKLKLDALPALDIRTLLLPREELEARITRRVDERLRDGALSETQRLLGRGYRASDPGMRTLGYVQLMKHIGGTMSLAEARQEWITKELQYTKRQRVYFQKYFKI